MSTCGGEAVVEGLSGRAAVANLGLLVQAELWCELALGEGARSWGGGSQASWRHLVKSRSDGAWRVRVSVHGRVCEERRMPRIVARGCFE